MFRFRWRVPCTKFCLNCISQVYLPSCGLVRISPEHFANWKRFCTFVQFRRKFEQKYFISVWEKHFITEWAPAISANREQNRACGLLGPKKGTSQSYDMTSENKLQIHLSKAVPIMAVKHQQKLCLTDTTPVFTLLFSKFVTKMKKSEFELEFEKISPAKLFNAHDLAPHNIFSLGILV